MFAADDEESDEASVAKVADESSLSMNPNIMLLLLLSVYGMQKA